MARGYAWRTLELRAIQVCAIVGLAVSCLLVVEYATPAPAVCTPGGGCEAVQFSNWGRILGIPTPIFGIGYFFGLLLLSLASSPRARLLLRFAAVLGGLAGLGLISLQSFVIRAICVYCVVVDVAAVLIAVAGLSLGPRQDRASPREYAIVLVGALTVSGAAVGFSLWQSHSYTPTEVPEHIRQLQQPGVVTVVEFLDFGCPHCRQQHEAFDKVLPSYKDRVRVVFQHTPIGGYVRRGHAARAMLCAGKQNEKAMAEALFALPKHTKEACESAAEALNIDMEAFRTCVNADATTEILATHDETAKKLGVRGLPTFWIAGEKFVGVQRPSTLRASIERALAQASMSSHSEP